MIRILLSAAAVAFVSASATQEPEENLSRWKANLARHQQVLMHGVPAPYAAMRDPMPGGSAELRRGAAIFDQQLRRNER